MPTSRPIRRRRARPHGCRSASRRCTRNIRARIASLACAVSTVLQNVVGNEVGEITLTSPTAPGVTRKWTRLQDYSDEVSNARIYAGFHYRFSTEAGKDMGKKIGDLAVTTLMLRAPWPMPSRSADRRNRSRSEAAVRAASSISLTALLLHQGDTIDLDIERPKPFGHANEDARRRIFRKIAGVDRVDGGEVRSRGAVDIALHHVAAATCPRSPGTVSIAQGRVRSDARSGRRRVRRYRDRTAAGRKQTPCRRRA